jgi:putative transcriptional regulator
LRGWFVLQQAALLTPRISAAYTRGMNRIKSIRDRLKVTQTELAAGIGRSQGNVAFYEKGQTVPPDVAKSLIVYAQGLGHTVTYDEIYGPADASASDTSPVAQGVANA